jgi:CBS domain-containing protein
MQTTLDVVVRDKGSDELITVPASATVAEAVAAMTEHEVGAVLIMNEDGLVSGIFTERDVVVRVVKTGRDPRTTPVSMVMTRDVTFVTPGTTIEAALSLMYVKRFRHLLVIDGPKVHGLLSLRDLAYQLIRRDDGRFETAVRGTSDGGAAG